MGGIQARTRRYWPAAAAVVALVVAPAVSALAPTTDGAGRAAIQTTRGEQTPTDAAYSFGDRVWFDANGDGIYNNSEGGVDGVTVTLYTADGAFVGTATTSGGGWYGFGNLAAADYYAAFDPATYPPGYDETAADVGTDTTIDSDVDTQSAMTPVVNLTANSGEWDLGLVASAEPSSTSSTTTTTSTSTSESSTSASTSTSEATSSSSTTTTTTTTTSKLATIDPKGRGETDDPDTTTSSTSSSSSTSSTSNSTTTTLSTTTSKATTTGVTTDIPNEEQANDRTGMCPQPGTRSYQKPGRIDRVHIVSPATGVQTTSGGVTEVFAQIDLADWKPLIGNGLPSDYGIFNLGAQIALTGPNIAGSVTIPVEIYCYTDDVAVDNPTRGYVEASVPWGNGVGAWTGIAVQVSSNPTVTFNGQARPWFGGDRVTLISNDSVVQPGEKLPEVLGVRIDENLFTTVTDRLEIVGPKLLFAALSEAIEGTDTDKKYSLSMKKTTFDTDIDVALNSDGTNGEVKFDITLKNLDVRVSVADPPAWCKDFDVIAKAKQVDLQGTIVLTGAGAGMTAVVLDQPDVDVDNLELDVDGSPVCGWLLKAFVGGIIKSKINHGFVDRQFKTFAHELESDINAAIARFTTNVGLQFNRFEASDDELIATFDAVVPEGVVLINPNDPNTTDLDDVIDTTEINGMPVDVGVYLRPAAFSLIAAAITKDKTLTATDALNGNETKIRFPVAPYAELVNGKIRFTIPGVEAEAVANPLAPVPGPHWKIATDFRGFGSFYFTWNPTLGQFEYVMEDQAADCTDVNCPTTLIWATTQNILLPLYQKPNLIGGAFFKALREGNPLRNADGIADMPKYARFPSPIDLELEFATGKDLGANAQGFLAIYGHMRPVATLHATALPETTTPVPNATGVFTFTGGWSLTTTELAAPVTFTATTTWCSHNPPSLTISGNQVTYSVSAYMGQGPGNYGISCDILLTATDLTGRKAELKTGFTRSW